jgi:hypothetical protein
VHALARGFKPGPRARIGPLELYDSGRYFTVTGHHVAGSPLTVELRTEQIKVLYEKIFPEPVPTGNGSGSSNTLDDEAVISTAQASKNGAKFTALWNGDISGHNNNHSEADAALCSHLAYWTNRDAAKMDRLFRRSKLFRPKWDEKRGAQKYGDKTIAVAIAGTARGYTPNGHGHVTFICAADVQTVKLEWLWHARLALGAITLFEGGPEKGKSTILVDLAARSAAKSFTAKVPQAAQCGDADYGGRHPDKWYQLLAAGADLKEMSFLHVTGGTKGDVVPFQPVTTADTQGVTRRCGIHRRRSAGELSRQSQGTRAEHEQRYGGAQGAGAAEGSC